MRKYILIGAAAVVLAVAGAVYFLVSNLDSIAKDVMEKAGSEALGVPVRVESVRLELRQGKATVTGLSVANPPGYSDNPALAFGKITVQVDPGAKALKEILAVNPTIRLEQKGRATNLGELRSRAQKAVAKAEKKDKKPSQAAGEVHEQRLKIELLRITDAKAILTSPEMAEPKEVVIPSLVLRDLSGTPKEIAGQVFDQLLAKVMERTAGQALREGAGQLLQKEGGGAGSAVEGLLKKLGGD